MPGQHPRTNANFTCPGCGHVFADEPVLDLYRKITGKYQRLPGLGTVHCPDCALDFVCRGDEPVWPDVPPAPPPAAGLPAEIIDLYREAATALRYSPSSSFALLQIALGKLCLECAPPGGDMYAGIEPLAIVYETKRHQQDPAVASPLVVSFVREKLPPVGRPCGTIDHTGQRSKSRRDVMALFGFINTLAE